MPHAFFTSYARADNTGKRWLQAVVEELSDRVRAGLGLGLEDSASVCFFDEDDILTGEVWEQRLAAAVNEARVLVCFCSKTFFDRPHCAKEFDVFRRRLEDAGQPARVVLPVIWEPVHDDQMPAALRALQFDHGAMPARYRKHGLRALKAQQRRAVLNETIDALAKSIVDMIRAVDPPVPPLRPLPSFGELADVFDNPGPTDPDLAVIVLHPDRAQWRLDPFGPTVRELLEAEFTNDRWTWKQADPESWLAGADTTVGDLLVVADSGQIGDPLAARVLDRIATENNDRIHLVLGVGGTTASRSPTTWVFPVDPPSPKQFRRTVQELLASLRVRNATAAPGSERSIVHEAITRSAEARGVDLFTQPTIQGPGGV